MSARPFPVPMGVELAERERAIVAENHAYEARIIADIAPALMELSLPGLRSHIVVINRADGSRDAIICDKALTFGEFDEMLANLTAHGWTFAPKHEWHKDAKGNRDGFIIHDLRPRA